jgi:hypothetical protein
VGTGPYCVIAADVNHDGLVDLISAGATLTVLTNNGSGGFGFSSSPGGRGAVVAADVNGDGSVDLVCGYNAYGANLLLVLTNNGNGFFSSNATIILAGTPMSIAAADVNADGKMDLISGNINMDAGMLTVFTNNASLAVAFTGNSFIGNSFTGNGAGLTNLDLTGPTALSALGDSAIGYGALYYSMLYPATLSTNSYNAANGYQALYWNYGLNNTANGAFALYNNWSGSNNVADGFQALYANTTGNNNIALGFNAGLNITTGSSNIDIGNRGQSSDNNIIRIGDSQTQTFIAGSITGNGAGLTNVTAAILMGSTSNLTLAGNLYLPATTASAGMIYSGGGPFIYAYGVQNFFAGNSAGNLTMTGKQNTAVGDGAFDSNMAGNANTAIGMHALINNTNGNDNTALGAEALMRNRTGCQNTALGREALFYNTSGDNTAVGYAALMDNTSGAQNTAVGSQALLNNNGYCNVANGYQALFYNQTGSNNTAIGASALYANSIGNQNTAIGVDALFGNTTGSGNTTVGAYALNGNTDGAYNVAVGYNALYFNTSGYDNIALGMNAGEYTTGNQNIDIGNMGVPGNNESGVIRIGTPGTHTDTYLVGTVTVPVLQITGGSDVAEPFVISTKGIPKGAVVVIDDENPGHLKMSDRACDKRVAGIVSGANGINPGLTLRQQGVTDGGENVALSGRVYALADASNGPIKPGDLLTTSATAGHCMKVLNPAEAQGAILGKAMTPLESGQGMVLVLVTLQGVANGLI